MTFANPIPWWAFVAIVSALAAVSWLAYRRAPLGARRRRALAALRFVTLLLLVLFLMRPVVRRDPPDGGSDVVVPVLVDTSRSMGIEDADGQRRIDRARDLLTTELLPLLRGGFRVEMFAFGDGVAAVAPDDLSATARRSDLSGALAAVHERFRGRPVAGIVLLSDGGDTSGAVEATAGKLAMPIYAAGIGSPAVGRDREVLSVTVAEAVLDDSRVDLAVLAVSHGHGTDPIALRLLENGRPLEVRRVIPAGDGVPVRALFQVSPGRGAAAVYSVEIPIAAGELVPENNTRSVLVQPPSRARRVLLVEGAPGFEHSFLRRALASDPGLEVDSVVRKGKNEAGADTFYIQAVRSRSDALTSGYPERPEALFAYDAIVLANVEPGQLSRAQLETTRAFVAMRGGGLLMLGARSFMKQGLIDSALEEVVPLELSGRGSSMPPPVSRASLRGANRVGLTASGEAHPVMQLEPAIEDTRKRWDAAPALAATVILGEPRAGATVLAVSGGAAGESRPLVAVQRFGEGRSMVFTGEASWRWRMMLPASDRSYDTFWRQAVRWLALTAPGPVDVTAPAGSSPGETLALRVAVRDAAFQPQTGATVNVRVTAPDGTIERIEAAAPDTFDDGAFVARFRPQQPGVYRVSADAARGAAPLGSAATVLLVGGSDLEMTDPRLNLQLLQRVTLASGGRLFAAGEGQALLSSLRAGVPAARLAVRRDLWHTVWSFAALVVLLATEWILRRRWGLR